MSIIASNVAGAMPSKMTCTNTSWVKPLTSLPLTSRSGSSSSSTSSSESSSQPSAFVDSALFARAAALRLHGDGAVDGGCVALNGSLLRNIRRISITTRFADDKSSPGGACCDCSVGVCGAWNADTDCCCPCTVDRCIGCGGPPGDPSCSSSLCHSSPCSSSPPCASSPCAPSSLYASSPCSESHSSSSCSACPGSREADAARTMMPTFSAAASANGAAGNKSTKGAQLAQLSALSSAEASA
mmetsp:Transcript_18925/g.54801  ORF Transcript_18925/g.54801 Transcript_18925/m.54801 type:complete len:242 (-) Transcript_18925:276-1001(-)